VLWRILLTALYASAFGAAMALENAHPGMPDAPVLAIWLLAPVVGFMVGRWWVVFAVVGMIFGRAIGWDAGENDGNVVTDVVFLGLPLYLGVVLSGAWQNRRRRTV
jgi:hypothetical protein